jgi:hypothetical protein
LQRALEFVTAWEDSADAGDLWIDFCQSLLCTGEFRNLD